jgi:hypothetical protein
VTRRWVVDPFRYGSDGTDPEGNSGVLEPQDTRAAIPTDPSTSPVPFEEFLRGH